VQGDDGSPMLDTRLEPPAARYWFHGHSMPICDPQEIGNATVVPLGDVAFHRGEPGSRGYAILECEGYKRKLLTDPPPFWHESRQKFWKPTPTGLRVHPDVAPWMR
jgi:hypothetical protein